MRVRLKGINQVTKRLADGRLVTYRYAWKGKGAPRLSGDPGSPEFIAAYYSAVERFIPRATRKANLQSLIRDFLESGEFRALGERTRYDYEYFLARIDPVLTEMPLSALEDRSIRADLLRWRDRIAARAPSQGDKYLKAVVRVISWAFERGIISNHHLQRIGQLHKSTRRNKVWTPELQAAFIAKAPKHMRQAFQLALWTAQRRGDLLRMRWSNYDGEFIRLTQSKTGADVAIAVGPTLKRLLDELKADRKHFGVDEAALPDTILLTMRGTSWTGSGFSVSFRKVCAEAGIKGVTFHDLRGTVVSRVAEEGGSVPEIASLTGHSLKGAEQILDSHYLPRTDELAKNAMRKLERSAKSSN